MSLFERGASDCIQSKLVAYNRHPPSQCALSFHVPDPNTQSTSKTGNQFHAEFFTPAILIYVCVCVLSFGKLARALWVVSSARENGRSSIRLPPIMGIFVDFLFGNGRATRNNHAGSREMSAKHWLNRISSTFLVVVQRKVARRSGFICANMLHKGVSLEVICTNSELVNNVSDLIF